MADHITIYFFRFRVNVEIDNGGFLFPGKPKPPPPPRSKSLEVLDQKCDHPVSSPLDLLAAAGHAYNNNLLDHNTTTTGSLDNLLDTSTSGNSDMSTPRMLQVCLYFVGSKVFLNLVNLCSLYSFYSPYPHARP